MIIDTVNSIETNKLELYLNNYNKKKTIHMNGFF